MVHAELYRVLGDSLGDGLFHVGAIDHSQNHFRLHTVHCVLRQSTAAESVSPIAEADTFAVSDEVRHGRVDAPGPSSVSFIKAVALAGIDTSTFPPARYC